MKFAEYREIVACLRGERVLFHYYPDRYAFMLLGWVAGNGVRLDHLRTSRYAPLLQKPSVRSVLANCGSASVERSVFADHWPADTRNFVLSLDNWHGMQTSRRGRESHNLVLQINFSREHMQELRARFGGTELFNSAFHPVQQREARSGRETLAWARIDLDLARGEALIEEIQSDWITSVHWALRNGWQYEGKRISRERIKAYRDEALGWLCNQWSEAMLAATVEFIRFELGIRHIYFHTWEGGNLTKGMADFPPPRSVYTALPKRFCLVRTNDAPTFLQTDRRLRRLLRARQDIQFYRLETVEGEQ